MTQTKFTPGPWFHSMGPNCDVRNTDGRKVAISFFSSLVGRTPEYIDECRANAHLIAAAPELYEAAIAMIAWDDSEEAGPDYGTLTRDTHPNGEVIWREWYDRNMDNCERAFRLARSATAKARGES